MLYSFTNDQLNVQKKSCPAILEAKNVIYTPQEIINWF